MPPTALAVRLSAAPAYVQPQIFTTPFVVGRLPECDVVFISSSSFVNKTAPRLIELSRQAHTVLVGPSTPLNPVLLDYGVDTITGFVAARSLSDPVSLAEMVPAGDIGPGFRVHRHRA